LIKKNIDWDTEKVSTIVTLINIKKNLKIF